MFSEYVYYQKILTLGQRVLNDVLVVMTTSQHFIENKWKTCVQKECDIIKVFMKINN